MTSTTTPAPTIPHWREVNAFGLPAGSIRALLALMVFGGIWAWLLLRTDHEVPQYLQNLLFIIMGHYFAVRQHTESQEIPGPPPLFLPRGVVRMLLVGGFVVVGILLFQQDLVWFRGPEGEKIHKGVLTLLLVAGFLLGVVGARLYFLWSKGGRLPRWLEDVRAVLSLAAAILLLLLVFELITLPDLGFIRHLKELGDGNGIKGALAAVVGFYFGSRS